MARDAKPLRSQCLEIPGASFDFKHPLATLAMKVMVMAFSGKLVARRFPGKFHWNQPSFFDQGLDGTVDGGDSKPRDLTPRGLQNLRGAQWTIGMRQNFADYRPLFRVSRHRCCFFDYTGPSPAPSTALGFG